MQGWLLRILLEFSHPTGVRTEESLGSALLMWMPVLRLPMSYTTSWDGPLTPPTGQPGDFQDNQDNCVHQQQTWMLWAHSQSLKWAATTPVMRPSVSGRVLCPTSPKRELLPGSLQFNAHFKMTFLRATKSNEKHEQRQHFVTGTKNFGEDLIPHSLFNDWPITAQRQSKC